MKQKRKERGTETELEAFQWTRELAEKFFHLRLQNDALFKRKKRPWRDFHKILMDKEFPKTFTINHARKKWGYSYEEYQRAVSQNKKKWLYYEIFNNYLGHNKVLDKYEYWSEDWRKKLVKAYEKHCSSGENGNHNDDYTIWCKIERELRSEGLPLECSVRQIPELWNHLLKIFYRKYKCFNKAKGQKCDWPLYNDLLCYFTKHDPDRLEDIKQNDTVNLRILKTCTKQPDKSEVMLERSKFDSDEDGGEFQWTRELTESFIHIRLQNDKVFRAKKHPWKDMRAIMISSGFPEMLTCEHLCRKWSSVSVEYHKALATGNKAWLYYDIFVKYLGEQGHIEDSLKTWPQEWIEKLILSKTRNDSHCSGSSAQFNGGGWENIELDLRKQNIPVECCLIEIENVWLHLTKIYKMKHKYAAKDKLKNWPYYELMKQYFDKTRPRQSLQNKLKSIHRQDDLTKIEIKSDENADDDTNKLDVDVRDDTDRLLDVKVDKSSDDEIDTSELLLESNSKYTPDTSACRVCQSSLNCVSLLDRGEAVDLRTKYYEVTGVRINENDNSSKLICSFCLENLEAAYNFRFKCLCAESQLSKCRIEVPKWVEVKLEKTIYESNLADEFNRSDSEDEPLSSLKPKADEVFNRKIKKELLKKPDQKLKPRKVKRRSKNVVMVPVKTAHGETTFRKTYVYKQMCEICGKSTQRMKEHMKSHSNSRQYKCPLCDKTFKYNSGLILHRVVHNNVPSKICPLCGKKFNHNFQYKRHMVYHANERKFSCETCGKSFNTKEILIVHMRSHTDERPYSCNICSKTFRSAGCVSRHKRVHRKAVKE